MAPRFSVLMPTWNRPETIGYAIRSVLAQTEPDFELLIVCDGCAEPTAEVVDSFHDDRIRWYDLPKAPGFGWANRNVALRQSSGDLVAFAGDDDIMLPDHLERMSAVFTEDRVEWAYSRPLWMSDDGIAVPFAIDLRRPDAFERFMREENKIPPGCVVHRRSCFERYGYWPEDLPHDVAARGVDWELWKRMLRPSSGANLAYLAESTVLYFRADWRPNEHWGPPPLPAWLRTASAGWWPDALSVLVPDQSSAQAATWHRLEAEGPDWARFVREAVVSVVDGFAWSAAAETPVLARNVRDAAREMLEAGDARRALSLTTVGLRIEPGNVELEIDTARAYLALGDSEAADGALRRTLSLDVSVTPAALLLIDLLEERGEVDQALTLASDTIALRPDEPALHARIGRLLQGTDDLTGAEEAMEDSLRLDPDQPELQQELERVRHSRRT